MKILIKETGEVLEDVKYIDTTLHKITIQYLDDGVLRECSIKHLSDVEELKDYEEPKGYWYMSNRGDIRFIDDEDTDWDNDRKQIGNYFETREEAEKAVEKLKAWKRLKDKGFRFSGGDDACISYILDPVKWDDELEKDFGLLFGGDE